MYIQKTQYVGQHDIRYSVSSFTISPRDASSLRQLHFEGAPRSHFMINNLIVEVYDRMLAQSLPCVMMVALSKPIDREKADLLNAQRAMLSNLASAAIGGAAKPLGLFPSLGMAAATRNLVQDRLRTYHAGDVIVAVEALVNGGIGPQHTTASILIKSKASQP